MPPSVAAMTTPGGQTLTRSGRRPSPAGSGPAAGRAPTLGNTALNRATLDRQMLLRRAEATVGQALERLVGMQAQAPFPPYFGLWARLAGFVPDDLASLLVNREVTRIALMRGTVHLVTAADCRRLRPLVQPVLDRALQGTYGAALAGLDLAAVADFARELVQARPYDTAELGRALVERWPDRDRLALLNAVRAALPLVQLPPRAVWGRSGRTVVTTADCWLGAGEPSPQGRPGGEAAAAQGMTVDELVLRYLGAFGPASVADARKWSGLTGLTEVFDRLRPGLRVYRSADGVELFDLPDAPRPDAAEPAPVRFLGEFDNLLLSYADTARILAAEHRPAVFTVNGIVRATLLVDGVVAGTWQISRPKAGKPKAGTSTRTRGRARSGGSARPAVLEVALFRPLPARTLEQIAAEGLDLLAFAAADTDPAARRVRIHTAG